MLTPGGTKRDILTRTSSDDQRRDIQVPFLGKYQDPWVTLRTFADEGVLTKFLYGECLSWY
jgi:hypothetical protein